MIANGLEFQGWEEIELTLRAEGFPPSFRVRASVSGTLAVKEGDSCSVRLGNDTVITGYIDFIRDYGDASNHSIEISGRGKTQDLVDCGAEWPSHQMINGNALTVSSQLATVYGISVVLAGGSSAGPTIPQWALNYGDTAAAIIQRVARNAGLLAYEDHLGRLILAGAGTRRASSGIAWGVNVEQWSVERSMDQRFSDYVVTSVTADTQGAIGGSDFTYLRKDPGVPRHRLTYLMTEYMAENPQDFTAKRADWEAARRAGRSNVVTAVVDSWRDDADALWSPNTLIPITLPGVKAGQNWIIAEVTYRRDGQRGTTAQITAMPPSAFTPEPITLVPVNTASLNIAQGNGQ
ncbi:MAG: hypothetical protein ABT10_03015 [Novosphingobium sp. SCN 63-17]|nr:MAG: hypothetical protein ABT10_03015 [Novosphingobium sp. SCN 63-17]OJX93147.1 MAG: hypothetical protein BGP00_23615 [Novosphingobium sp. 63-713]